MTENMQGDVRPPSRFDMFTKQEMTISKMITGKQKEFRSSEKTDRPRRGSLASHMEQISSQAHINLKATNQINKKDFTKKGQTQQLGSVNVENLTYLPTDNNYPPRWTTSGTTYVGDLLRHEIIQEDPKWLPEHNLRYSPTRNNLLAWTLLPPDLSLVKTYAQGQWTATILHSAAQHGIHLSTPDLH